MATTFTSTTLSGVYRDDFNQDDNYHQILFNSGRALQARELTQLQTLLYQEMGRFGRNIFKEGAAVSSGGTSINAEFDFVQIDTVVSGGDFADIPIGTIMTNTAGVQARVVNVQPLSVSSGYTADTLYLQYINSGENTASVTGSNYKTFSTSDTLLGRGYELTVPA